VHRVEVGSLDAWQCQALVNVLKKHTETPDQCITLYTTSWGTQVPDLANAFVTRLQGVDPGVDYLGIEVDIRAACLHDISPTMWWPQDRAWIVVSQVDLQSTYVGCSSEAAQAILLAGIEALRVSRQDEVG
jgi:hypothetical protein